MEYLLFLNQLPQMVNNLEMANEHDKFLLVSDSNEVSSQWDSKRLSLSELTKMAQDILFKTQFGYMSEYLTRS